MENYSNLSSYPDNDNDSISDDSRKIRKQRNTYQKIPDDIRVQLLECVKNGETLKAAAKRFKVNYSSAKSILHTYRKEGRILKKVAQERCPKKRDNSSEDDVEPVAPTKPSTKKEKAKATSEECEIPQVYNPERTVSMTTCATLSDENRPTMSNIVLPEDMTCSMKMDGPQEGDKALNQRPIMNLISQDHGYMTRQRKRSIQLLDSFFSQPDFHFPDNGNGADNAAGSQFQNDEYSSFNDMMSAFHRKASFSGDLFNNDYAGLLGTKVLTPVNGQDKTFKFDHQNENLGHYHFKSFLDTQNLLREAFRKGSISRYRKNSFDMF